MTSRCAYASASGSTIYILQTKNSKHSNNKVLPSYSNARDYFQQPVPTTAPESRGVPHAWQMRYINREDSGRARSSYDNEAAGVATQRGEGAPGFALLQHRCGAATNQRALPQTLQWRSRWRLVVGVSPASPFPSGNAHIWETLVSLP